MDERFENVAAVRGVLHARDVGPTQRIEVKSSSGVRCRHGTTSNDATVDDAERGAVEVQMERSGGLQQRWWRCRWSGAAGCSSLEVQAHYSADTSTSRAED
jgi:hypothetical protein